MASRMAFGISAWGVATLLVSFLWWQTSKSSADIGENAKPFVVTAAEYGAQWGFEVPSFTVHCINYKYDNGVVRPHVVLDVPGVKRVRPHVVLKGIQGMPYGLNGAAMGSLLYRNAEEIMKRDANGLRMFKGPHHVLERGLELCEAH